MRGREAPPFHDIPPASETPLSQTQAVFLWNLGLLPAVTPHAPHAEGGGDQKDTHGQGAGDGASVKAVLQEGIGVAPDGIVHGIVNVCPRDQREEGYQEIRGGGALDVYKRQRLR